MASIRKLKKDVNYLSYELLTEVFAFKHFHPEVDEKKFDKVIKDVVNKRNEIISKLNHTDAAKAEDKMREHFEGVKKDMISLVKSAEELNNK
jgi:DNA-binding GntR family transcriptional regulator